jgi:hypothetical protein
MCGSDYEIGSNETASTVWTTVVVDPHKVWVGAWHGRAPSNDPGGRNLRPIKEGLDSRVMVLLGRIFWEGKGGRSEGEEQEKHECHTGNWHGSDGRFFLFLLVWMFMFCFFWSVRVCIDTMKTFLSF